VPRRLALVTGSSRGIGAATAERLARDGFDVAVHYHREREGAEATLGRVRAAGARGHVHQADLSRWNEAERLFKEIQSYAAGVDVLVNNAGVYPRKYLHETTAADWESTLATNVGSMFHCGKLAAPHMVEEEWGRIVNLSSVLGTMGSRHGAAYAASKAAVLGLTKSLARELAPSGITVNAVAPGAIETDILRSDTPEVRARRLKEIPAGRVGSPEEVAAVVAFLARDDAGYVNGQTLHVNGAFLLP
jgi:3-oxoacyl-[acyl-carrier protein] reductase